MSRGIQKKLASGLDETGQRFTNSGEAIVENLD
jgi:hypothetical protein